MRLEVDGVQYENFTEASVSIRLDTLTNGFSFSAAAADGVPLPFKGGESCKILVDGEVVITGSIEVVDVSYDSGSHSISIQGRDKTGDILDSTLTAITDITAGITLKSIIEKVIENIGSNIKVIDNANPAAFDRAEDIVSPEDGENAFRFIDKYANKRQVLLVSNSDGDVVIEKNTGVTGDGAVQHIIDANDNNVISSSFSYDTTGRYNVYKFSSQLNLAALNAAGVTDLASVVNQGGGDSDNEIRAGRQLVLVAESPYSNENCALRSQWERDIRRAKGLVYSATVQGFRAGIDLWKINTLYPIIDDFLGKNEPMLCNSIDFNISESGGKTTMLGFVDELAYTLKTTKPRTSEVATNVV